MAHILLVGNLCAAMFQAVATATTSNTLDLISYGFNVFTTDMSGSPILDTDFLENDIDGITPSGDECLYESMKFTDEYGSFSSYASSSSLDVENGYSVGADSASGTLSTDRQKTRSAAQNSQYYIYSMKTQCAQGGLSVGSANELHWNSNFLNNFRILPKNYTGDLTDFKNFWSTFGTHVFNNIRLGGLIEGTIVASKCDVEQTFSSMEEYKACLDAQYSGASLDACQAGSSDTEGESDATSAFEYKRIIAKGGDLTNFATIVETFDSADKTDDFNEWIGSLSVDNWHVVGGTTAKIWKKIESAILMGDHTLNNYSSAALSDDEWMEIAMAMEDAYDEYTVQLIEEQNSLGDCDIDSFVCTGGYLDEEDCLCISCNSALECCGIDLDTDDENMGFSDVEGGALSSVGFWLSVIGIPILIALSIIVFIFWRRQKKKTKDGNQKQELEMKPSARDTMNSTSVSSASQQAAPE